MTTLHHHWGSHDDEPEHVFVTSETFRVSMPRRLLDIAVAASLLVLCSPFLAVVAVLILISDGRPVLFRQIRLGEGAEPFTIYKFRTMKTGDAGPEVTTEHDDRIIGVGKVLRRLSLDELPQLWHVLTGKMTLVGPRPESLALAKRYPRSCRIVLFARPGLTGPAQLTFRERSAVPPEGWVDVDAWYLDVLVPLRTDLDLDFLSRPTLGRTLHYLVATALFVVGLKNHERTVDVPSTPLLGGPRDA